MVYSVVSYTVEVTGAFELVGAVVVVVVGFEVDVLVLVDEAEIEVGFEVDVLVDEVEVVVLVVLVEEGEEELVAGVEVGSSKQEQAELTLSGLSLQFSR
jgi:hypothetical protein